MKLIDKAKKGLKEAKESFIQSAIDEAGVELDQAHKIIDDWTTLGLIVDGKPVSKTKFKQLANVIKYGRGNRAINVAYFYTNPKEMCYQFDNGLYGDTKATVLNQAYEDFIEVIEGNMEPFDDGELVYGNSGLPQLYSQIYVKNRGI